MGTQAELNQELGVTVHVCSSVSEAVALDPQEIFRKAHVLAIDDAFGNEIDIDLLRSGLRDRERKFKARFDDAEQEANVIAEIWHAHEAADRLFRELYPDFVVTLNAGDFRPMVTKAGIAEPMHFDTRPAAANIPYVTSFLNVAATPRVYHIGPTLPQLVERQPKLMRQIWMECGYGDVSADIRKRTLRGMPPLNADTPVHKVAFAPGTIWFFDAKTVSHEVIYGAGAVARWWCVPDSGAPQQLEILARLK